MVITTRDTFLTNIRHEIRTPLNAINGYSQMLAHALDTNEQQALIEKISKCSRDLAELFENILEISRIESGDLYIQPTCFSPINLIEDIKNKLQKDAIDKGLCLNIIIKDPLPCAIWSDKERISQILINLISNAIKFTAMGEITVEVKKEAVPNNRALMRFYIKDTGVGISKEDHVKLFKKFTQLDNSHTRKYPGMGLGLALSQRLAREINGDVELLSSQIGIGSTFVFKFTSEQAPSHLLDQEKLIQLNSPKQLCLPIETDLENKKILIVDDSVDNIQIFRHFLNSVGCIIDTAENGYIAVGKASKNAYDFILMDIHMPVMDGIEAVKLIRARKYRKPIIALTAYASNEAKLNCINSGFTDLIVKPVNKFSLIRQILQILNRI